MFRRLIIIAALLFQAAFAQAGEAARVVFVTGQATLGPGNAILGAAVQEGDEITTGADGYIYLKTIDNGFLILRPNTKARVAAYRIDKNNPANTRVKLELMQGVARSISGDGIKNARQNFRFNTPVAAIGVRGTDFTVYTDQQTSRVAVISGGVVVAGFAGTCTPGGSGPCEGDASRELFAHQAGQLLQVRKGQPAPQVLRNSNLAPDVIAPPRNDEPAGKSATVANVAAAVIDPSIDLQKNKVLVPTVPAPQPPVQTPPPVVDVTPPVPKTPEVLWGRWYNVANLPVDTETLAKLRGGTYEAGMVLESFVISRVKQSELVMPKQGTGSFALQTSEAYIQRPGQGAVAANVQSGRLDVDFGSRAFTTNLTVVAPGTQVDVQAKGDVTLKGELISSIVGSNATVRGYLGGAEAKEAGYIFKSHGNGGPTAFGGVTWAR